MDKQKTSVGKQLKQANYLKRIEKFDEAIALYHQAIDINPNFALSYYYLSEVLAKVGNLEEAVNQLKIAIKIQPKSAFIRYKYGLLLYQQGYMEKSFEYWFQLSEENIYLPGLINKSIENYRVNYVKQKVCFVHIPKTGGKSINRALYGKDLAWDSLAYHRSIRDHKFKENLYKFCVIRNPFSFYVSLYHFFREYRNKIKNPLRQISDLSFSDFIYILTDYEKLKEYINQNLVNLWHHDLAYIKSENRQIGFFTNYYLYMCFNDPNISRLDVNSILKNHNQRFAIDRVIKLENLPNEFESLMKEWEIPALNLEKLNSSHHQHWQEYYNPKTKQLVLDKDWLIFKLYYPDCLV